MKFLFTLLLLLPAQLMAYVVTNNQTVLTDGSSADTQAACNYVGGLNQDGWTVVMGTNNNQVTWTTEVVWGPTNSVTLMGMPGGITIFGSGIQYTIFFAGVLPKTFTLGPNITFQNTNSGVADGFIGMGGEGCSSRITGCTFLNCANNNFVIQWGTLVGSGAHDYNPGPYGLIDHCQFNLPGGEPYNCVQTSCNGELNVPQTPWVTPMSWGTTNCLCIENCGFYQPTNGLSSAAVVEGQSGARICLRNNQITNFCASWHGTNSGTHSSTLQVEAYNNTFYDGLTNTPPFQFLARGGTFVIFSNTVVNDGGVCSALVKCEDECAATNGSPPLWEQVFCPAQLMYPGDYVSPQQIGQGSATNGAWQSSWPAYIWSNNCPSSMAIQLGNDGGDGAFIQQGRDIFTNQPMPGYSPLVYPHPLDNVVAGPATCLPFRMY